MLCLKHPGIGFALWASRAHTDDSHWAWHPPAAQGPFLHSFPKESCLQFYSILGSESGTCMLYLILKCYFRDVRFLIIDRESRKQTDIRCNCPFHSVNCVFLCPWQGTARQVPPASTVPQHPSPFLLQQHCAYAACTKTLFRIMPCVHLCRDCFHLNHILRLLKEKSNPKSLTFSSSLP